MGITTTVIGDLNTPKSAVDTVGAFRGRWIGYVLLAGCDAQVGGGQGSYSELGMAIFPGVIPADPCQVCRAAPADPT